LRCPGLNQSAIHAEEFVGQQLFLTGKANHFFN
jgi:hypothetical protein